jgi:hypothetical protein
VTASPCIPLDELERVASLPPGDPLRRHVAECPRCSALVDSYMLFASPGDAADAPHVAAADARLAAFLEREIGAAPAPAPRPAVAPAPGRGPSWFERLTLRPAFALAAVAALALWPRGDSGPPVDALRGGPAAAALEVRAARLDDAGLSVEWNTVGGADAYEVRVYAADLSELARLNANGDTVLAVSPSELSFRAVPGQALLVRVFARAGGAERAASAPVPVATGL